MVEKKNTFIEINSRILKFFSYYKFYLLKNFEKLPIHFTRWKMIFKNRKKVRISNFDISVALNIAEIVNYPEKGFWFLV